MKWLVLVEVPPRHRGDPPEIREMPYFDGDVADLVADGYNDSGVPASVTGPFPC